MAYEPTVWVDGENKYHIKDQDGNIIFENIKLEYAGEEATPVNAGNLNKIEQGIFDAGIGLASYMAFCGNVNADMLDAAFGKNNEEYITGLGRQLAMYAWFKGDSKITYPFTELSKNNNMVDIVSIGKGLREIYENSTLHTFLESEAYAIGRVDQILETLSDTDLKNAVCGMLNLNPDSYATTAAVFSSDAAMAQVAGDAVSCAIIARSAFLLTKVFSSDTAIVEFVKSSIAGTQLGLHLSICQALTSILAATLAASAKFSKTTLTATASASYTGNAVYVCTNISSYLNSSSFPVSLNWKHGNQLIISSPPSTTNPQKFSLGGAEITLNDTRSSISFDIYTVV